MYTLEELKEIVNRCNLCKLAVQRTNVVFGQGNEKADILFIGEGPGYHEDVQGLAFVGPAGKLLTQAIESIGLKREDVYIANIVKCRPPNNRTPYAEEAEACIQYLRYQVKIIKPKIIVCLGSVAAVNIIDKNFRITRERGKWIERKGIWILPTFHPAAVLRDAEKEMPFLQDFLAVRDKFKEI